MDFIFPVQRRQSQPGPQQAKDSRIRKSEEVSNQNQKKLLQDPWHAFFVHVDGQFRSFANNNNNNNNNGQDRLMEIGVKGASGDGKRKRNIPPQGIRQQPLRPTKLRTDQADPMLQQVEGLHLRVELLRNLPAEIAQHVLLDLFVPKPEDFPAFGRIGETPSAPRPRDIDEDDIYSLRGRGWHSITDIALTFRILSDVNQHPFISEVLGTKTFRRLIWRRWLDAPSAGSGSGHCQQTAVPPGLFYDKEEVETLIRHPEPYFWYTRGFLGSVILHRALLNSARNVLLAREISSALHDACDRKNDKIKKKKKKKVDKSGEEFAMNNLEIGWMDAWVRGDQPTPSAWLKIANQSVDPMWRNGWFAPQLAHGLLQLDFMNPKDHGVNSMQSRGPKRLGGYHRKANAILRMMRDEIVQRASYARQTFPMVARIPSLLLGSVLGGGQQLTWGVTHNRTGGLVWLRTPLPFRPGMGINANPKSDTPMINTAALVISGIPAVGPEQAPRIGLVLPTNPRIRHGVGEENLDGNDGHGFQWYSHWMDVWLSDIRFDSPESTLELLRRIGSRQSKATWTRDGWKARYFKRRLGDQLVPKSETRMESHASRGDRYMDGKVFLLSRCWMPVANRQWLRGHHPSSAFYDRDRRVWTIDVGEGTHHVWNLALIRCYGGPALPTVIPDLRMRYLTYAVPVYRQLDGQEDVERIRRHGRIDRILLLPKEQCILDRVFFTTEALSNSAHWVTGGYDSDGLDLPRFGFLWQKKNENPPKAIRTYDWDRVTEIFDDDDDDDGGDQDQYLARRKRDLDKVRATELRTIFSLPGETVSRTDLQSARALLDLTTVLKTKIQPLIHTLQWSNILLPLDTETNPLANWLQAMDKSGGGVIATIVWLTLHSSMYNDWKLTHALSSPKELNDGVVWSRIGFRFFSLLDSVQLSVRLRMTQMPFSVQSDDDGDDDEGEGVVHQTGLLDRLQDYAVSERMNDRRGGVVIVDFSDNAIQNSRPTQAFMSRIGAEYGNRNPQLLRILLGGNPIALMDLNHKKEVSVIFNMYNSIGMLGVDALGQALLPNALDPEMARIQRRNWYLTGLTSYVPAKNLDATLPWGHQYLE